MTHKSSFVQLEPVHCSCLACLLSSPFVVSLESTPSTHRRNESFPVRQCGTFHTMVASVPHAWHTEWPSCIICVHASPFCEGHTMTKLPNTYQFVINHGITLLWLFSSLLKYLFLFLLLCLCVPAGVHVPCEQVPKDGCQKKASNPRLGAALCGCWEANWSPLQQQRVSITEPSLQPHHTIMIVQYFLCCIQGSLLEAGNAGWLSHTSLPSSKVNPLLTV